MSDNVLYLLMGALVAAVGLYFWTQKEKQKKEGHRPTIAGTAKSTYDGIKEKLKVHNTESDPELSLVNADQDTQSRANVQAQPQVAPVEPVVAASSVESQAVQMPTATPKVEPTEEVKPVTAPVQKPIVQQTAPQKPVINQGRLDFANTQHTDDEEEKAVEERPIVTPKFPKEGKLNYEFDDLTESVGLIQSSRPIEGKKMLAMASNLRKLELPIRIYVKSVENKRWYEPREEGSYNEMAVVLLLATRQTCVNEMIASRFVIAMEQVGIALDADSDSEPISEIVSRARRLFEAVQRLDVQLSVVLKGREAISAHRLNEAAVASGFTQLNPTRYFLGEIKQIGQAVIFLRANEFDANELNLMLDAPLASPNNKPLHVLFSVANDLCCRLDLEIFDPKGQPINSASAQTINEQLNKYYEQMRKAEIEPGSPRARLLFSRD